MTSFELVTISYNPNASKRDRELERSKALSHTAKYLHSRKRLRDIAERSRGVASPRALTSSRIDDTTASIAHDTTLHQQPRESLEETTTLPRRAGHSEHGVKLEQPTRTNLRSVPNIPSSHRRENEKTVIECPDITYGSCPAKDVPSTYHALSLAFNEGTASESADEASDVTIQRLADWHFGGMEHTLRGIDNRMVSLHTACPGHTPEVLMSGHILRTPIALKAVRRMMLPPFREMMQRLSANPRLVVGTIDTCARLAVPESQRNEPLKLLMTSSRAQALRIVGESLRSGSDVMTFEVKWLIMDLCLPVLLEGDVITAEKHLRALLTLRKKMDLADGMDSLIWYVTRSAAICHALQTAQAPLYRLEATPTNDHWAVGYGQFYQPPRPGQCGLHGQALVRQVDISMPLRPGPSTTQSTERRPTVAAWRHSGLITATGELSVRIYVSAVGQFLRSSDYENGMMLNLMYNQRLAALHRLCSVYSDHIGANNFDDPLTIALQLHLALDLGGLLLTTINTLSSRLYASLRLTLVDTCSEEVVPLPHRVERWKLEAWIFLTGSVASAAQSEMHHWFTTEARERLRMLHECSAEDVRSVCNPFQLSPPALSPVFIERAEELEAEACIDSKEPILHGEGGVVPVDTRLK
jgi:hypothetical protein